MYYGLTIGERLKKLREDKGEKQQDVANAILVDRTVISFFERNERKPDVDKLIALAKHFDVTTDFLLCQSDVKKADITLQAISKYIGLSDEAIRRVIMSRNALKNKKLLDGLICSSAFVRMLTAFDDAGQRMTDLDYAIYLNKTEIKENEEKIKNVNYNDDGFEEMCQINNLKNQIEAFEGIKDEQIDICSVKMLKIVRSFFEEIFQAEDKQGVNSKKEG